MFTINSFSDSNFIGLCAEGFLCGLYSGIFAIYLQIPSKECKTAIIVYYALCILYVLSVAAVVSDTLAFVLATRINSLSLQVQNDSQSILFHLSIVQIIANGFCDFIAQCILTYRCWIVWGKDTRVIIVPSFLAITYLATWLAAGGSVSFKLGESYFTTWGYILVLTGLASSMAVNTLVTGLIVYKIVSVERRSSSLGSNSGDNRLRHIVFIIIESGMALFAIQLIRVVLTTLGPTSPPGVFTAANFVVGVHQMFNGIAPTIILVRVSMKLSFDDEATFMEAASTLRFNNPPSDPSTLELPFTPGYKGTLHQEQ